MFKLFKQRNFNDIFNDTFTFLKVSGKNFFKNYFIVNGPLLLILTIVVYLVGQVFIDGVMVNVNSPEPNMLIEEYFKGNFGFFFAAAIGALILLLILTLLSYSYPVIYFKLFETNIEPDAKQITKELKKKAGRIILFSLLWLVTFLPLLILLGLLSILLFAIIIGIPFAIIAFAGISSWMTLSFFDYLNTGNGYFTSFKNGFKILYSKFWTYAGSTALFYLVIYMLQSIISMIPYLIAAASIFTGGGDLNSSDTLSTICIMMLVILVISILLTFVLGNILYINQGMIYYSYRDQNENTSAYSEIDLIGNDNE